MSSQNIYNICVAAKVGDIEAVKYYINLGININELYKGNTALMYSLLNNHVDITKLLIDNKATILCYNLNSNEPTTIFDFIKSIGFDNVNEYINFLYSSL